MRRINHLPVLLTILTCHIQAVPNNPNTTWFQEAQYGIFMHFLPQDAKGLALVEQFDVTALAQQLETSGAGYFILTLGQNSGYFNAPNSAYDRYTGYEPGERCARRDLPLELYRALEPKRIKLMLYLPCQVPNEDPRAQKAFGLPEGKKDQPLDLIFARKWAEVIQEWSERYGDKVAGWWFDGGYDHIHFTESIANIYAQAVKRGNPKAIVTFNPGVKVTRHTQAEDYTAGELNKPFEQRPASRWLEGSQWHALTFIGSNWAQRDTRYSAEEWADWVKAVTDKGGVVTLDMGPNYDSQTGPVGTLASAQLTQVEAVKAALAPAKETARTVREDIEWTRVWVPGVNQTNKPRVLLIGDSIVEGYGGSVEKRLIDQAYVARLATSKSLGDPAYLEEVTLVLRNASFQVVHFNNGLHGGGYSEKEYGRDFPKLVKTLRAGAPTAKLIYATTTAKRTPHRLEQFDPFNDRVRARNRIAREFADAAKIVINDLFGLVEAHPEFYSDDGTHFNTAGVEAEARQVAESIRIALSEKSESDARSPATARPSP